MGSRRVVGKRLKFELEFEWRCKEWKLDGCYWRRVMVGCHLSLLFNPWFNKFLVLCLHFSSVYVGLCSTLVSCVLSSMFSVLKALCVVFPSYD